MSNYLHSETRPIGRSAPSVCTPGPADEPRHCSPSSSRGPPKPLCTCPRHANTAHPASAATDRPSEGTDWAQVITGTALVAVAVPTLAVAGAALLLPALGFASTGVVGGASLPACLRPSCQLIPAVVQAPSLLQSSHLCTGARPAGSSPYCSPSARRSPPRPS